MPGSDEVEAFFADSGPADVKAIRAQVLSFIATQQTSDGRPVRPIVCVTSGGTTVPLERNCVRFVDNFSGGTRGALSTERFLEEGYAVIFLNRKHSIQPFTKGVPSGEILECLPDVLDSSDSAASCNGFSEHSDGPHDGRHMVHQAIRLAAAARQQGTLLRLPFETLFEYLAYLREIAEQLQVFGRHALFYLAAAVSDFYIPWSEMEEHKIQSSDTGAHLTLKLRRVPKMLAELRQRWAPEACVASFKLETDEQLLLQKAVGSIQRYDVHMVVANILATRKEQVQLVHASSQKQRAGDHPRVQLVKREPEDDLPIEAPLVAAVVQLHNGFRSKS